ncbi:MAG: hypothetical protein GYB53_10265 [Rhodobacteraceae bacterium]|nr:hypothetical protein [Paracoccaceae bacterium]
MVAPLSSSVAFNPYPVLVSGQPIDSEGRNEAGLEITAITWNLSRGGGEMPAGSATTGVLRLAIPLGPSTGALLQNTTQTRMVATDEEEMPRIQAGDTSIYVLHDSRAFRNAGLTLSTAINADFCSRTPGTPAGCTDPVCILAAGSGPPELLLTIQGREGEPLPVEKIDEIEVQLVNCVVSHHPGEALMRLLSYDVSDGTWPECPSRIVDIPVTKLPRAPGVSALVADPPTQFLAPGAEVKPVELSWMFSLGGVDGIRPSGQLTIGRQGEAPEVVALDTEALSRGSHTLATPGAGVTFVELDYTLAGEGSQTRLGGKVHTDFAVVGQSQPLLNPEITGTARFLGTPQADITEGRYTPSGDGYLLCVLEATGAPTDDPPTPQAWVEITQDGVAGTLVTVLSINAASSASVSASTTLKTTQLVPLRGGRQTATSTGGLSGGSGSSFSCTWLPIGSASFDPVAG